MPRKSRKNVGLIGLGIIGSRAATGLRAAGFQVFVWNRTPKPAPNFLGSPAEVAELCEIVQLFVADAQALFEVLDLMSEALTSKHIVICNATVGPEATLEAARLVEERGARFLDAPFTGSRLAAEKRDLVYYIGGDDATFLRARPVLEATSKAIVRIGDIGHAATLKVVTNMISAVSTQVLSEALAIVQKAGLDAEVLAAALEHNACRSATIDMKLPKMARLDYEPHFSLKHMFKDVQLGIHVANALDIEIPTTTVTAGVMYGALNQGWGDLDFAALHKVYDQNPTAAGGELVHSVGQLQDLDSREAHYPETRIAAPAKPSTDIAAARAAFYSTPERIGEPTAGAPTVADALSAPDEMKTSERARVEAAAVGAKTEAENQPRLEIPGIPLGTSDVPRPNGSTAPVAVENADTLAESLIVLEAERSEHSAIAELAPVPVGAAAAPSDVPNLLAAADSTSPAAETSAGVSAQADVKEAQADASPRAELPSDAPARAEVTSEAAASAETRPNEPESPGEQDRFQAPTPVRTRELAFTPVGSNDESVSAKTADDGERSERPARPFNFVKRWFVAKGS